MTDERHAPGRRSLGFRLRLGAIALLPALAAGLVLPWEGSRAESPLRAPSQCLRLVWEGLRGEPVTGLAPFETEAKRASKSPNWMTVSPDDPGARGLVGIEKLEVLGEGGLGKVWRVRLHFRDGHAVDAAMKEGKIGPDPYDPGAGLIDYGTHEENGYQRAKRVRDALGGRERHINAPIGRISWHDPEFGAMRRSYISRLAGEPLYSYGAFVTLDAGMQASESAQVIRRLGVLARDVLRSLGEMDAGEMVHRDLKPENILFSTEGDAPLARLDGGEPSFEVIDFGNSIDLGKPGGGGAGTPGYTDPATWLEAHPAHPSSDFFSFGTILAEYLTGLSSDPDPVTPRPGRRPHLKFAVPGNAGSAYLDRQHVSGALQARRRQLVESGVGAPELKLFDDLGALTLAALHPDASERQDALLPHHGKLLDLRSRKNRGGPTIQGPGPQLLLDLEAALGAARSHPAGRHLLPIPRVTAIPYH